MYINPGLNKAGPKVGCGPRVHVKGNVKLCTRRLQPQGSHHTLLLAKCLIFELVFSEVQQEASEIYCRTLYNCELLHRFIQCIILYSANDLVH